MQPSDPPEPRLPGDLPDLPDQDFPRRAPMHVCKECGKRFATAPELNEHTRIAHLLRLAKGKRRGENGKVV